MIEFDGMTFTNSDAKDKFLDDREDRRKRHHDAFSNVNRFNHGQATMTDVGVYVSPGGGPRGVAKLHVFNDPNFLSKIQSCPLFKEEHPEWQWDATGLQPDFKQVPDHEWKLMSDGLKVKLTSKNRQDSPYAGMTLPEILKKNREDKGKESQTA